MRHRSRAAFAAPALIITGLLAGGSAQSIAAQETLRLRPANELMLSAEPLAAGIRFLRGGTPGFRFGAALTAGPLDGVELAHGESGELDEWATAHIVLSLSANRRLAFLGQAGAVLALGDDFSSVYPSGQGGVELALRGIRLGSAVRAMRIAGGDGEGNYRLEWVPLRVGWALTW